MNRLSHVCVDVSVTTLKLSCGVGIVLSKIKLIQFKYSFPAALIHRCAVLNDSLILSSEM